MKKIITLLLFLIVFSSCEFYEQDEYKEHYVIESYLIANDTLPEVRLSTTSPIQEEYNFEDVALSGAEVEIQLLNSDSTIATSYSYIQEKAGIYKPDSPIIVQDKNLYRLHVKTSNGDTITATTFVPEDFETINKDEVEDRYLYQSEQQIEVDTTPSSYITGRQTFYIFTVNASNPILDNMTPFYKDLVLNQGNDIENYYVNSSGIINEGNYEKNSDGTITLKVPWLAISFFGPNDIIANAIDDNMYDFLRSQDVQTGGSTLSPGEIQNIRYNVNGGIGIFGSMSSDTNFVEIVRPDQSN
jgi:hypothetical protein